VFLEQNKTTTCLDLGICYLEAKIIVGIAMGLRTNTTLLVLNLSGTKVQNRGAIVLADAMQYNRSLKSLNLRANLIGDVGACALAEAIDRYNRSLTRLYLSNNKIREVGIDAFAKAIKRNSALEIFEIGTYQNTYGNEYDPVLPLFDVLYYNTKLRDLHITGKSNLPDPPPEMKTKVTDIMIHFTV
jgi:Ran GTPase-activating protein (RanGAP) involved in mRNA processing and transport